MNYPKEARVKLALQSQKYVCDVCGPVTKTIKEKNTRKQSTNEDVKNETILIDSKKNMSSTEEKGGEKIQNKLKTIDLVKKENIIHEHPDENKVESNTFEENYKKINIENIQHFDNHNNNHGDNHSLKKSMSTDSTSNLGFTNTLKVLRQKQFASIPNEDVKDISSNQKTNENKDQLKDPKTNSDMILKKHMSFLPSSSHSKDEFSQVKKDEYFNNKNSESFKQKRGLSSLIGTNNQNQSNEDIIKNSDMTNKMYEMYDTNKKEIDLKNTNNKTSEDQSVYESFLKKKKMNESTQMENNNFKFNENLNHSKQFSEINIDKENSRNEMIKNLINEKMNKIINKNDNINAELIKKLLEETKHDRRLDKYNVLKSNNEETNTTEFNNINKRKNYVYNLYLYNKYTEAKFRRMTICGLILIIALSIVVAFTFSESLKNSFLDLIKNIDLGTIEFE